MSIQNQTRFSTRNLTDDTLVLVRSMFICNNVSILCLTGTLSIQGDMTLSPDMPSEPVVLTAGKVVNLPAKDGAPIDGVTLIAAGNSILLISH
jgi:hypothetical protein